MNIQIAIDFFVIGVAEAHDIGIAIARNATISTIFSIGIDQLCHQAIVFVLNVENKVVIVGNHPSLDHGWNFAHLIGIFPGLFKGQFAERRHLVA